MHSRESKTIEHDGVTITVTEASVLQSTRRSRLIHEALQADYADPDMSLVAVGDYADVMAATTEVDGMPWPITAEEFAELDAAFVEGSGWLAAVRELNPQWYQHNNEAAKKNDAPTPTNSTDA
jgi:hypothetical protein